MKFNEMITEEMVKAIIPNDIPSIYNSMYINQYDNIEIDCDDYAEVYDLARFLFVDAWDYFEKKGWYIEMYTRIIRVSIDDIHWHTVVVTNYPSRLHAMAAAVAYIWEQENA